MAFLAEIAFVALLAIALALNATPWGQGGHPSNALVMTLAVLACAPAFGVAGCIQSALTNAAARSRAWRTAMFLHVALIVGGAAFWTTLRR